MNILHRDDLALGGFAGLIETRLVMDPMVFGQHTEQGTWPGIGDFVYLADARFLPHGETRLHAHKEIDVISVMVEGRIAHEGSLQHGQQMGRNDVQVQRAGGEGFSHNEVNPDSVENRMIQIWVMPERAGEPAAYKFYQPEAGQLRLIYGGSQNQDDTFDSHTQIQVGLFEKGQKLAIDKPSLIYITRGSGQANGEPVTDGDLVRSDAINFSVTDDVQIIVVSMQ